VVDGLLPLLLEVEAEVGGALQLQSKDEGGLGWTSLLFSLRVRPVDGGRLIFLAGQQVHLP